MINNTISIPSMVFVKGRPMLGTFTEFDAGSLCWKIITFNQMLKSDRNFKIFTTKTLKVVKFSSQNLTLNNVETIKPNREHMMVGLQLRPGSSQGWKW